MVSLLALIRGLGLLVKRKTVALSNFWAQFCGIIEVCKVMSTHSTWGLRKIMEEWLLEKKLSFQKVKHAFITFFSKAGR